MNPTKQFLIFFLILSIFFSSIVPAFAATKELQKTATSSAQTSTDYKVKLTPTQQTEPSILNSPSINNSSPQINQAQAGPPGLAIKIGETIGTVLWNFGKQVVSDTTNIFKFEVKGLIEGLLMFLISLFIPPDKVPCIENNKAGDFITPCLLSDNSHSSLIELVAYSTDYVSYNLDFGTKEYLASLNPFAAPVYAQTGTALLTSSILTMWQSIRNFAFVALALILVVIGFMVMLRTQVAPRVVATATSALPKIVLVLIMITFSFPIGALAIDFVRVLLNVVGCGFGFFCSGGAYEPGIFREVALGIIGTAMIAAGEIPAPIGLGFFAWAVLIITFLILSFVIVARVGIAIIKEWFMLFMLTLFAPLILLPGAVPGNGAIGRWFKDLISSVLCIVSMYLFITIAAKFIPRGIPRGAGDLFQAGAPGGLGIELPSFYGTVVGLESIFALGILMYVPAICNVIRHALDIAVPTPGAVGVGEAGQGAKGAQNVVRLATSAPSKWLAGKIFRL